MYFFFVKRNTAYEMRISYWSSDVCSSDLHVFDNGRQHVQRDQRVALLRHGRAGHFRHIRFAISQLRFEFEQLHRALVAVDVDDDLLLNTETERGVDDREVRSEEHTSELQSLMRNSYAVFCLKQNINTTTSNTYRRTQNSHRH